MDELLNTAPCGFLSFASDGTISLVNTTLADWLGSSREELQGRSVKSILSMGGRVFYETHFWPQLNFHGHIEEIYFSLRSSQGESVPILANAVRHEREGSTFYDCTFFRIHQRDQYENELILAKRAAEEANQTKADFLSMMSHELRTPLGAIAGFTQLLLAEADGPITEEQREDLEHIQTGSQALLRLINDILNFAHMEREGVEFSMEEVHLEDAIQQAESLIRPRLQEAGLHYHREQSPTPISIFADAGRVQQILLNLLTNAIKFTPSNGDIQIRHSLSGGQVLIHVQDSGLGIAEDQLQRVFDPFVQVNRLQVKSSQRGIGLGLTICRKLARAMGGELTATSTLGQGSTFTLALPLYEQPV